MAGTASAAGARGSLTQWAPEVVLAMSRTLWRRRIERKKVQKQMMHGMHLPPLVLCVELLWTPAAGTARDGSFSFGFCFFGHC